MPTEPEFYPRPYFGQPFKLVQNEHNVEYGAVTGLKYTAIDPEGKVLSWTACITSTTTANGFRFYHNTPMNKTGGWMPLSAEEIAEMRRVAGAGDAPGANTALWVDRFIDRFDGQDSAINALQKLVDTLEARLDKLTENRAEVVTLPSTPDGATPPAPQQTNGRAQRVAPAGRA